MNKHHLVLLPGLGADARMFDGQRAIVPDLVVPEWIEPVGRESLADYGRRMAETITPNGPLFLGGSSFGGMVALEMARHIAAEGVILIGSCRHPRELRRLVRWCAGFSGHMPRRCNGVLRMLTPCAYRNMAPGGAEQRRLLEEMSRSVSMPFIRWGAHAMVNWAGAEDLETPVYRVHGERDRIIPPGGLRVERVIEGAGHVPSMSHPDEVNDFIERIMSSRRSDR